MARRCLCILLIILAFVRVRIEAREADASDIDDNSARDHPFAAKFADSSLHDMRLCADAAGNRNHRCASIHESHIEDVLFKLRELERLHGTAKELRLCRTPPKTSNQAAEFLWGRPRMNPLLNAAAL